MEKVVEICNISFGYEQNLVLDNVSLDIFKGDYLGIVGPNGSAKSTLLKLILNVLKPDKGSISILGEEVRSFKKWGRIGYISQKAASFNSGFPATVEEVVRANLFPLVGLFKSPKKEHDIKVHEALTTVGMEAYAKKLIGNLSGGQQQKVFIARALVSSTDIIFMDEPTVGIDMKSQDEFYHLMDKLNKELGITLVMVSHDIGLITEKVNRLVCMGNKKLIVHHTCCDIPLNKILTEFYGDKMKLMVHHHH